MTKVKALITENDLRDTAKIHQNSKGAFALACYLLGQVDKWEYLKAYILIEQQKDKTTADIEENSSALKKLDKKKGSAKKS